MENILIVQIMIFRKKYNSLFAAIENKNIAFLNTKVLHNIFIIPILKNSLYCGLCAV